jgi:hypothetical protein
MNGGRRRAAAACVLAGAALLVAACGGGSHPAAANSGSGQLSARSVDVFAACIRSHGVPGFYFSRTPPANSTALTLRLGPWIAPDPGSAQFQAASKACRRLFPGGPPGPITQQQKEQMLRFAACIRAHGYPSYPDPQFPSGGGVMRPQPTGIDISSPRFQATAQTCNATS